VKAVPLGARVHAKALPQVPFSSRYLRVHSGTG